MDIIMQKMNIYNLIYSLKAKNYHIYTEQEYIIKKLIE